MAFEQGNFGRPTVLGGLYNGVDTMPERPMDLVDGGTGAVNRRSMVSRLGHRIDLRRRVGQGGHHSRDHRREAVDHVDHTGTTITLHADGKVLIEGTQGITIDSASANIDLKGNQISLKATSGVTVDGGSGAVGEGRQPAQPHRRQREARRQWHHRGEGRLDVLGPAGLVKIN